MRQIFEDQLDFNEVTVHTDLTKDEWIKELNELKDVSDAFEKKRGKKEVLCIAIVVVGYFLDHVTYKPHEVVSTAAGWKKVETKTLDSSVYCGKYCLTKLGEPIGIPEYAAHIAEAEHTHVMCMFDHDNTKFAKIEADNVKKESEFHEFVLERRPGQARLSLAFKVNTEATFEFFRDMREKENQNCF
jgi:hypothetical protein